MYYGDCYMRLNVNSDNLVINLPCYPDEIGDSTSVNWAETGIVGRSTPIYSYTSTSARAISFSFDLHREMPKDLSKRTGTGDLYNIENIIKVLRKCAYPNYENSGLKPPIVMFRFGKFKTKGIVTNVSFTWKKPIVNKQYQLCSVSISMYETPNSIYGANNLYSSMNPFNVGN